jgi:hypothetical protein
MSRYDFQDGGNISSTVVSKALKETKDLDADSLSGKDSTYFAKSKDLIKNISKDSYNGLKLINRPIITYPVSGSEDIIERRITANDYSSVNFYSGDHNFSIWEVSLDSEFINIIESVTKTDQLTEWLDPSIKNNTTYYVRVRYGSDIHISEWSLVVKFTTGVLTKIKTPEIFVSGEPDNVGINPTLSTSSFVIIGAPETHLSTDWVIEDFLGSEVLNYNGTSNNLLELIVPDDVLEANKPYTFKARHNTQNYSSDWGEKTLVVLPSVIIEIPELDIQGRPNNISVTPTITSSPFNVSKGNDVHIATDWVIENTVGTVLWTSLNNTINLTNITIPNNVLEIDTPYYFKCRYIGLQTKSNFGVINGTTGSVFYDNIWTPDSALPVPLEGHDATILPNGDIIVMGGFNNGVISDKIFKRDNTTHQWTLIGNMPSGTAYHTQTLLEDGRIFICGGLHNLTNIVLGMIYNPTDATWSPTLPMPNYRYWHSATLLKNGLVLITGGYDGTDRYKSSLLYDPINDKWFGAKDLPEKKANHASVTLPSGRALIIAGHSNTYSKKNFIYIPDVDEWVTTEDLPKALNSHSTSLLPNGMVMTTGGLSGSVSNEVFIYDENSHSWSNAAELFSPVSNHSQVTLPDGKVLVIGGNNGYYVTSSTMKYS